MKSFARYYRFMLFNRIFIYHLQIFMLFSEINKILLLYYIILYYYYIILYYIILHYIIYIIKNLIHYG